MTRRGLYEVARLEGLVLPVTGTRDFTRPALSEVPSHGSKTLGNAALYSPALS